ncbi:hypothetical protein D3C83_291790 [compost metagenome]
MLENGFHSPEAAPGQDGHLPLAAGRFGQLGRRDACCGFSRIGDADDDGQRDRGG